MPIRRHAVPSMKGRLALPFAFALLAVGCAAAATPSSAPASVAPSVASAGPSAAAGTVTASITEYRLVLGATSAPAGSVTFDVKNDGTIDHEFVVFKTDLAVDKLPLTADGTKVDEEGQGVTIVDEIAEFGAGKTESLTVDMPAGHYVLICNVPSHYTQGIRADFTTN
jgi:uncharacterized cupredoxin-like copper-binding protein